MIKHVLLSTLLFANVAPRAELVSHVDGVVALVEGDRAYCTGFVVGDGVLVTAEHCTEESDGTVQSFVTARFRDGYRTQVFVLAHGSVDHRDFAVLVGDTHGMKPLVLSSTPPRTGDACEVTGHGGGSDVQHSTPCVVIPAADEYLTLAATIIGGDSGSPVIDLETGTVIGVAVRSSYPFPWGRAVHADLVAKELARALGSRRTLFR